MTEKRSPFDPNQSPLDRIAEICDEHPSREHSAGVALYLQECWEYDRSQRAPVTDREARDEPTDLSSERACSEEHNVYMTASWSYPHLSTGSGFKFARAHLLNDLILALKQCERADAVFSRLNGHDCIVSPDIRKLIAAFTEHRPQVSISKLIEYLESSAGRAVRNAPQPVDADDD
jgi:hypothetical protein